MPLSGGTRERGTRSTYGAAGSEGRSLGFGPSPHAAEMVAVPPRPRSVSIRTESSPPRIHDGAPTFTREKRERDASHSGVPGGQSLASRRTRVIADSSWVA